MSYDSSGGNATLEKQFELRYVGARFNGARLPVDLLSDLPAFRDLLAAFARDNWRRTHANRKRVPKGFEQSIAIDLVGLLDGSAVPKLSWNRELAQTSLPGFSDELADIVDTSYGDLIRLIDGAARDVFPKSLSSQHIHALNRFGSGLRDGERIEFRGSSDRDGNVVYLDNYRRKRLVTHVQETYLAKYEGVGALLTNSVEGSIVVRTPDHGDIKLAVPQEQIVEEFDGNLGADVQFDLLLELDSNDRFRSVFEVFDVALIDASVGVDLMKRRQRIEEIRGLGAGWLNGSGAAISRDAVDLAQRLLMRRPYMSADCRVYPTEQGGVLFELEVAGWDYSIECLPDGQVEMYGVEVDGSAEMEPVRYASLTEAFIEDFDNRMNANRV